MPYLLLVPLALLVLLGHSKARPEQRSSLLSAELFVPPPGQRCSGRNFQGRRCCTPENPCDEGEGDCDGRGDGGQHDGHEGCKGDLICGSNNCRKFGAFYHEKDDCCEKPSVTTTERLEPLIISGIPFDPPLDQRCSGRNYQGRRCCTPENPCNEGEGDCDGPGDGGGHDGHAGCKGDLVCGSNNCMQFGLYYHQKDDCCEKSNNDQQDVTKKSKQAEEKLLLSLSLITSKRDKLELLKKIKWIPGNWSDALPPHGSEKEEADWAWA